MTNDEQFLIENLTTELILLVVEEENRSLQEAIDRVYNSETYAKLLDLRTGLYTQSPRYLYDFLKSEN